MSRKGQHMKTDTANSPLHGGDIYSIEKRVMDFSVNINPLGMPWDMRKELEESVADVINYPDPDCGALREAIAELEGIGKDRIICGNGAAELIYTLFFALRPERVLLSAPGFSEYERAAVALGAQVGYFNLREDGGFGMDEGILSSMDDDLDMLILANPNNPTGRLMDRELLKRIKENCRQKGILFVLDECFLDFCEGAEEESLCRDAEKGDKGIFILKSFTKMYAMPGVRLGYGICSQEDILRKMQAVRQPWSVSGMAQRAGITACKMRSFRERAVMLVKKEREYMLRELSAIPSLRVYPSQANFILFRLLEDMDLYEGLLDRGFLIRDCSNYTGLKKGYYRVAVRGHEENKLLLAAIGECLKREM